MDTGNRPEYAYGFGIQTLWPNQMPQVTGVPWLKLTKTSGQRPMQRLTKPTGSYMQVQTHAAGSCECMPPNDKKAQCLSL
eukprot:scaffold115391_cov15-Prasinocladus_malaysianus.AAC.1